MLFIAVLGFALSELALSQTKQSSKAKDTKSTVKAGTPTGTQAKPQPPKAQTNKTQAAKTPDKGVMAMFMSAQQLYKAGKYEQALSAYGAIFQKYPSHEPTIIQMGKTLYRLDRIQDAYSMFTRVNPMNLDEETSYEYGFSFYTAQHYEGCLFAFKRVPQGHALYDLANYYGAVCAMKLRRYQEAEDMLEKAMVLPDKLAKSRALYLKHVQALRLMQEKSDLARDRKKELDLLTAQKAQQQNAAQPGKGAKKPDLKKPDKPPEPPKPEGYKHAGFCASEDPTDPCRKIQAASLNYEIKEQETSFSGSGGKVTTSSEKIGTFSFATGALLPIPMKVKKNQAAGGIQLELAGSDSASEGETTRIISEEDDQELVKAISEKSEKSHSIAGEMWLVPWFEFPLPQDTWLYTYGELYFNYPEFKRSDRSGSKMGGLGLARKWEKFTVKTRFSYTEVIDSKNKPTTGKYFGFASIIFPFSSGFTVKFEPEYKAFRYFKEDANGVGTSALLRANLSQTLPLSFSVGLRGIYEYQYDNLKHNIGSYESLSADGHVYTGRIFLDFAGIPYFYFATYYLITQSTWIVEQEEAQDVFEQNVPTMTSEFYMTGSLDLKF